MPETPTDRANELIAWVRQTLANPDITLEAASSDASFRSYWRTSGHQPALIVMDSPPALEDVRPWLDIGRQLASAGIHVPAVRASDAARGFVLIEDFGRRHYLDALNNTTADTLYRDAMDALLKMQTRMDGSRLPAYDAAFLRRELDLLQPWFLERHLGLDIDVATRRMLDKAFDVLIDSAAEQPACFVHRDYHSRNLMLTAHDRPGVIDFQGALRGPLTYDLVSLLRDCYISWDETRVDTWREYHRLHLIESGLLDASVDSMRFRRWFDLAGLQRHIKVMGLFCRLALRDGKPAYLADLPRVLDYVLRIASRHPELADLGALFDTATSGRDISLQFPKPSGNMACAP